MLPVSHLLQVFVLTGVVYLLYRLLALPLLHAPDSLGGEKKPYSTFQRNAEQRKFARSVGNQMENDVRDDKHHTPVVQQLSENSAERIMIADIQDTEWEAAATPGRVMMARKFHTAVDQVMGFVITKLAIKINRLAREEALRKVREKVYIMNHRDPLGTKTKHKKSFTHFFLESLNRKRLNRFVDSLVEKVMADLLDPNQINRVRGDLSSEIKG